jgi:amidohydrolase
VGREIPSCGRGERNRSMGDLDMDLEKWVVGLRREFHMYPELSGQEIRTTGRVLEILEDLGVEARAMEGMTGAVGLIKGCPGGFTLALRADMDGLPIQEMNQTDYRSRTPGVMHACGHDAHTAVLLGVARAVVESSWAGFMKGNLLLVFQPSEERVSGAREMISRGVLEKPRVDWVMAAHVVPDLKAGAVGLFRGASHASADSFNLHIQGKGTHGGRPNEGVDPILAGAHFVTGVQSIVSRNVKPTEPAVVTVGKFHAGSVGNVIPETAQLEGTVRALSQETRSQIMERLEQLRVGMDRSFGVQSNLEFQEGVPVCMNNPEVSGFLYQVALDLLGPERVLYLQPAMGAEDFALFARERPGAIFRLGCGKGETDSYAPLHSPYFDLDESCLMVGVRVFTEAARRLLAS